MTAEAVDAALQQARMYLDVDNHQRAREVLAHALSMAPDHPALLIFDAQAAIGLGDYIGAERRLYAALKSAPDNEHAIRLYALALRGQGRFPRLPCSCPLRARRRREHARYIPHPRFRRRLS